MYIKTCKFDLNNIVIYAINRKYGIQNFIDTIFFK